MEHLVELGMDSLRVPVLRALNDQGHEPSRHGRAGVPLESFRLVQVPKHAIAEHNEEREWARYISAETCYNPHDSLLLVFGRYRLQRFTPRELCIERVAAHRLWSPRRQIGSPYICFGAAKRV